MPGGKELNIRPTRSSQGLMRQYDAFLQKCQGVNGQAGHNAN